MRVHKYESSTGTFYVLSGSDTKPLKGKTISEIKWLGWANPGNKNIVEMGELSYSTGEKEKKKEEKKAFSIIDVLRNIAQKSSKKEYE